MDPCYAATGYETGTARVNELNRHLMAHGTATAALVQWCRMYGLSDGRIRTCVLDQSLPAKPSDGRRGIGYRRVELLSGPHVLSAAEIRFRCEALSPDMLFALQSSDKPFGAVVAPLGPRRITTFAEILSVSTEDHPGSVLVHHATVVDGRGRPIARVREVYQTVLVA